jgi:hypothetical protein
MIPYPKPGRRRNARTAVRNVEAMHFLPALGKQFRRSAQVLSVTSAPAPSEVEWIPPGSLGGNLPSRCSILVVCRF